MQTSWFTFCRRLPLYASGASLRLQKEKEAHKCIDEFIDILRGGHVCFTHLRRLATDHCFM